MRAGLGRVLAVGKWHCGDRPACGGVRDGRTFQRCLFLCREASQTVLLFLVTQSANAAQIAKAFRNNMAEDGTVSATAATRELAGAINTESRQPRLQAVGKGAFWGHVDASPTPPPLQLAAEEARESDSAAGGVNEPANAEGGLAGPPAPAEQLQETAAATPDPDNDGSLTATELGPPAAMVAASAAVTDTIAAVAAIQVQLATEPTGGSPHVGGSASQGLGQQQEPQSEQQQDAGEVIRQAEQDQTKMNIGDAAMPPAASAGPADAAMLPTAPAGPAAGNAAGNGSGMSWPAAAALAAGASPADSSAPAPPSETEGGAPRAGPVPQAHALAAATGVGAESGAAASVSAAAAAAEASSLPGSQHDTTPVAAAEPVAAEAAPGAQSLHVQAQVATTGAATGPDVAAEAAPGPSSGEGRDHHTVAEPPAASAPTQQPPGPPPAEALPGAQPVMWPISFPSAEAAAALALAAEQAATALLGDLSSSTVEQHETYEAYSQTVPESELRRPGLSYGPPPAATQPWPQQLPPHATYPFPAVWPMPVGLSVPPSARFAGIDYGFPGLTRGPGSMAAADDPAASPAAIAAITSADPQPRPLTAFPVGELKEAMGSGMDNMRHRIKTAIQRENNLRQAFQCMCSTVMPPLSCSDAIWLTQCAPLATMARPCRLETELAAVDIEELVQAVILAEANTEVERKARQAAEAGLQRVVAALQVCPSHLSILT